MVSENSMLICFSAQSSSFLVIVVIIKFAVILFLSMPLCVYVVVCAYVRDMRDMRATREGARRIKFTRARHIVMHAIHIAQPPPPPPPPQSFTCFQYALVFSKNIFYFQCKHVETQGPFPSQCRRQTQRRQ